MSTPATRIRGIGIYHSPPHLTAEEFENRMERLARSISELPGTQKNLTRYELNFSTPSFDPNIAEIGLPTTRGSTVVVVAEAESEAHMAEFIGNPQVAKLSAEAMEDLGLKGDNRGFGARVVKLIGE
ncbi:hypothetical protein C8J57DRAFT_1472400 [Mycena rebaudengoi]|nr:hypothetical protein C8J57DRAFT_1472400 [Mycena rebaudengoi]